MLFPLRRCNTYCNTSRPVYTFSLQSPTVNYRKIDHPFDCNIFLSHFAILHGFAWPHMELPTREKLFSGGYEHVDTVGVTGSNPVSRTIIRGEKSRQA